MNGSSSGSFTPLVRGSFWLHGAAALATVVRPSLWPWTAGAVAADHLLLTTAGLVPRCTWLGPNWTRLPVAVGAEQAVAVTLDDGPDPELTPRVLDVLAAHEVSATFFCIGARVVQHPALAREIVARGHDVENHSQHHAHRFSLLGPAGMAREVREAQDSIAQVTGRAPRLFRAPAGLRNPFLQPVLARAGLQLTSWTRRGFDTLDTDPARILRRLTRALAPGDILLLHDGGAARAHDGAPVTLAVLPGLLRRLRERGLSSVRLRSVLPGAGP